MNKRIISFLILAVIVGGIYLFSSFAPIELDLPADEPVTSHTSENESIALPPALVVEKMAVVQSDDAEVCSVIKPINYQQRDEFSAWLAKEAIASGEELQTLR